MFESMRLENFKSWEDTGDIKLAPLTGFFGTNSSGKTSLLQALLLLKQTAASSDRRQTLNLGDDSTPVSLGLPRDLFFAHDERRAVGIEIAWQTPTPIEAPDPADPDTPLFEINRMSFETVVSLRKGELIVEGFRYDGGVVKAEMTRRREAKEKRDGVEYDLRSSVSGRDNYLTRVPGRAWPLPSPVKCYGFPDEVAAYYRNAGFLGELELELERQVGLRLHYLGPLRSVPARQYTWQGSRPVDVGRAGERAIEAVLSSDRRGKTNTRAFNSLGRAKKLITVEEHVAQWLKQLDLIHSFAVERVAQDVDIYRVRVQRAPDSEPVALTDVGFGVSQILPVLVLLAYAERGSTVLLEQPEIHLHPSVQSELADILIETATVRGVQVIMESHSEHLLKRLQLRVAEMDNGVDPDTIALHFCDNDGRRSRIQPLRVNVLGEIENWPENFFGDQLGETARIVKAGIKRARLAS